MEPIQTTTPSTAPQNSLITSTYETVTTLSSTCLSTVTLLPWTITGTISSISSICVSKFYDCFIDGNKPWKQIKYLLSLDGIVNAFHNKNSSLIELKETFLKNEKTDIQIEILNLIDHLLQDREIDKCRIHYGQTIDCLRRALSLNAADIEYTPFLEKICLYRFTELHLFSFCEILINYMVKEGIKKVHYLDTEKIQSECQKELWQIPLLDQFNYIDAVPQYELAPHSHLLVNLIKGGCNIHFDPQRGNNIPYALFDFALNDKIIRVLRCGTPTMQRTSYKTYSFKGEATITPEFICLNESLAANNKKLLFISLQDNLERYVGTEKPRNNALIELQEFFPETFHLMILANDSPFYHQKGIFEQIDCAQDFKVKFLSEMLSEDSGFFIPSHIVDTETLMNILDEVHVDLYLKSQDLNRKERLDFIEFFYARLTLHALKKSKADYLINCCKDSIDRAGIRNALLQYLLLVFYQKEESSSHLNELFVFLHVGPLLVKKRAVNLRHERLLSVLELLASDDVRARIYQRKDVLGVQGHDLEIQNIPFTQTIT